MAVNRMAGGPMCPRYEKAITILGKKWTGLLLRSLMEGPQRFSDFRTQIPALSDRLLSQRLKDLEAEGIVNRVVIDSTPVQIRYELTQKGKDLGPVVAAIQGWAEEWC